MPQEVFARRGGFEYAGTPVDRGQIVALQGLKHDWRLVDLGYFAEVNRRDTPCPCGVCGQAFIDPTALSLHGRFRHPERERDLQEQVAEEQRLERMNDELGKLYLDRTKASRESGAGVPDIETTKPKRKYTKRKTTRKRATRARASRKD